MTDKAEREFAANQAEALSDNLVEFLYQNKISWKSYNTIALYNKLITAKLISSKLNSLPLARHEITLKGNTLQLTQTEGE